jgi:hypothetical protein
LGGGGRLATSVVLKAFGEIKGAGAVKMTFVGPCTRVGAEIITKPFPGVTCKITVSQASKGKIKGKSKVYLIKLT